MILELDRTACKDLNRLDRQIRDRVIKVLKELESSKSPPSNLDIKPIKGSEPWLRLRIGTYRVLLRKMTPDAYVVHRIVHRKDLDREAQKLG